MSIRIGVKLPHTGPVDPSSIPERARRLEQAGFDSLWVSDHVVMPEVIGSRYPFAADGVATWATDQPWTEALVALAAAAAVTSRVGLGTAVLVLPQRNPVLVAKQVGSLDAISGGRVELGVGAGWMQEEFVALAADFDARGRHTEEWIELLRTCWTGRPAAHDGPGYHLPPGTLMMPTPVGRVPVHVGGHSPAALRRAGQFGDGWLAQQAVPRIDPQALRQEIATVHAAAAAVSRDAADIKVILRLVESAGREQQVAEHLGAISSVGVDEIVVDVDPFVGDPVLVHDTLRAAAQ